MNSFSGLKDVTVEVSKTVLYGPNEAGKSRIRYALALLLHPQLPPSPFLIASPGGVPPELFDVDVSVSFGGRKITFRGGKYECDGVEGSYEYLANCIARSLALERYAMLLYDGTVKYGRVGGTPPRSEYIHDVTWLLGDAEVVEAMEPAWTSYTKAEEFYVNKAKVSGRWVSVNAMSYGAKRTMVLQYLVKFHDIVMVEAFESGLHADLMIDLLDWMTRNGKYVVIETHHGMVLQRALELGWKVYYVEDGKAMEVTRENVNDIRLYRAEIEAYSR